MGSTSCPPSLNWWYEKQKSPVNRDLVDNSNNTEVKEDPLKVLEVLQKSRKGRVRYDTGWDKQPFSILKLISDVQADTKRHMQKNLERAILISEHSAARAEYQKSLNTSSNSPRIRSVIVPQNKTSSFQTAHNTLSSPCKGYPDQFLTPRQSLHGFEEEYNEEAEADTISLASQSPIFAKFKRLYAEFENERVTSWLSNCRQKAEEIEAIDRRNNEVKRKAEEKQREENEERRRVTALERDEKRVSLEKRISEERRLLEIERDKEQELTQMRQLAEKEKLELLEEQRRKEEEEAKILAEEEAARASEDEKVQQLNEERQALLEQKSKESLLVPSVATVIVGEGKSFKTRTSGVPLEFVGAVLEADLNKYLQTQKLLENITENIAHISSTSARTKIFYFAAIKVINTPLNSIPTMSPSQLQTKLNHFINILDGKPVFVETMTTPFLSSGETYGNVFVLNMLAYRFVKKPEADTTKSDKVAGLTPLANLGAQLVKRYPEWSTILQAYFYKLCPFLVPFSYPRNDLSVEQYAVSIGQDLTGNERAIQQGLIERLAGYCTLYALIVVQFEMLGVSADEHEFFTLNEVWKILAKTLHINPQLDVTATVLHTILDIVGDKLAVAYKTQFQKFLQILTDTYLAKIVRVTPPGKAGALTRLELFLESKATSWFRRR